MGSRLVPGEGHILTVPGRIKTNSLEIQGPVITM